MEQIKILWEEYQKTPFPTEAHISSEVEIIDITIAGIVSGVLANNGKITKDYKDILESCLKDLDKEIEKIPLSAHDHFLKLKTIGEMVLNESKIY